MNIEKEREAFEAAYARAFPIAASRPGKFDREDWGDYVDASVGIGWRMWQAGRSALQSQDAEDAERYRYLRVQDNYDFEFAVVKNPHFDVFQSPQELDEAIDHARRVEGEVK